MFIKAVALIAATTSIAAAQNSFTYQGTLQDAGSPADGNYDMRFTLWDDFSPGAPDNQIGSTVVLGINVVEGLFQTGLDMDDDAFQSTQSLYLQIEVRLIGDPAYTTLSRQRIDYTPRAFHALTADQASSIELPFLGSGSPNSPTGGVFSVLNTDATGSGVTASGPQWGVVGFGGNVISWPVTPTPAGVSGIGEIIGVTGASGQGTGVFGSTFDGIGGEFTVSFSNPGDALSAHTSGPGHAGVFVKNNSLGTTPTILVENGSSSAGAYAIHSITIPTSPGANSAAIRGENRGNGFFGIGVYGSHDGAGWGVLGASGPGGLAGRFAGDVTVTGTLIKSGGSFKIDHPQDPANRYLSHSFVESPDMKNIYDGVITLGADGQAVVALPSYFEALNQEFRYQLTCVGGYAPVYISSEIASQEFVIAGGHEGLKVSWQVTGVRHDAWADQNRIVVEEEKSSEDQGRYLNPGAFGKSKEDGIGHQRAKQGVQAQN